MPVELHMSYSQLKPLAPIFDIVREAANQHIMNDYDGFGNAKDPTAGRRRTRAQYLSFGKLLGVEKTKNLLMDLHPSLRRR